MSETQHFRGKLREVITLPGETLEEYAKSEMKVRGETELPEYCSNYVKFLTDEEWAKYIDINGRLYHIVENKELDADGDICEAKMNSDGTIDYEVRFYNGGCGLDEAIEEAVNKMNEANDE